MYNTYIYTYNIPLVGQGDPYPAGKKHRVVSAAVSMSHKINNIRSGGGGGHVNFGLTSVKERWEGEGVWEEEVRNENRPNFTGPLASFSIITTESPNFSCPREPSRRYFSKNKKSQPLKK